MEAVRRAIEHGVVAGRLREAVRVHGTGLRGLERLAARHSALAGEYLAKINERCPGR